MKNKYLKVWTKPVVKALSIKKETTKKHTTPNEALQQNNKVGS